MASTAFQSLESNDIPQLLEYIPADDRDTWIYIGMVLKSELGSSGFYVFDNWSQKAENYNSKAVKSVWKSFKGGGLTISTLVKYAMDYGWRPDDTSEAKKLIQPKPARSPAPKTQNNHTKSYALKLWLAANKADSVVTSHSYAVNKGIESAGGAGRATASGRIIGKSADCIVVPIRNIQTGRVQGVQCINKEGRKQTFGSVSGGALILGCTVNKSLIWYVCEGWASAYSMVFDHQDGNGVCACSFGKGNLENVAELIAEAYDPVEIVVLNEVDS